MGSLVSIADPLPASAGIATAAIASEATAVRLVRFRPAVTIGGSSRFVLAFIFSLVYFLFSGLCFTTCFLIVICGLNIRSTPQKLRRDLLDAISVGRSNPTSG